MLFESSNLCIFRFERSKTLKRVLRVSQFFSRSTDMDIQTDLKYCVQQSNNVWKRHKGKNFNRHLRSLLYIVSWNDNYYFFFFFSRVFFAEAQKRGTKERRDYYIRISSMFAIDVSQLHFNWIRRQPRIHGNVSEDQKFRPPDFYEWKIIQQFSCSHNHLNHMSFVLEKKREREKKKRECKIISTSQLTVDREDKKPRKLTEITERLYVPCSSMFPEWSRISLLCLHARLNATLFVCIKFDLISK